MDDYQIKGFTFFRSYYEALQDLDEAERAELLQAVLEFVFDGVEPELTSKNCRLGFKLMRPSLEKSIRNAQNGALGGAPKGNQYARKDPAKKDLKEDLNKGEDKEGEKQAKNKRKTSEKQPRNPEETGRFSLSLFSRCLDRLNERTGASYTPTGRNAELLTALFEQGHTEEQILQVINRKCDEWLDVPHMRPQLTPAVLFKPEKFKEYLQAAPTDQEKKRFETSRKADADRKHKDELRRERDELNDRYQQETDRDRRHQLRCRLKDLDAMIGD